ncbi:hypothetical protein M231_00343 [Tremella mesenterica]|uniref:RIC1 C-terminal alpha solenoid region domain-containing protein n=1 Tax=Tremella mesenterica TaxID=5217 RepID=A0A4Q1BW20_TREME|nr:uncharacterized protein TREMEDRAFT_44723 [Tremella mesenterica DSM 1558]EIW68335.1 hypothetical protein TREMEDRAFT_44723 [Tremella mesenterica DSM 1558]RXK42353.1 hypothetical protein M231_00343 [Tremella mesenterica]
MYWPTTVSRQLSIPWPTNEETIRRLRSNKKGNFFAILTETTLSVWDVRPTVLQLASIRTPKNVSRWGNNDDVFWSHDGRGIIVLTSNSHLLFYTLVPSNLPAYTLRTDPSFPPGDGPGEGDPLMGWQLDYRGAAFAMGSCTSLLVQTHNLMLCLRHPPAILTVPYPLPQEMLSLESDVPPVPLDGGEGKDVQIWEFEGSGEWMRMVENSLPIPRDLHVSKVQGMQTMWIMTTTEGRVYALHRPYSRSTPFATPHNEDRHGSKSSATRFAGRLLYPSPRPSSETSNPSHSIAALGLLHASDMDAEVEVTPENKALEVASNGRYGLIAVGCANGNVEIITLLPEPHPIRHSHTLDLKRSANLRTSPGLVTCLQWTSDGFCLAVGYQHAWAVWSVSGRLAGFGAREIVEETRVGVEDTFNSGVADLFWAPGNLELFVRPSSDQTALYSMPFVKSATTTQHSPDNTRYAFLQMDDRVLVYRGADQPDMSVINPESDVWEHVKIPSDYIATNWPIRYASISSDGKFIAVAGGRGLAHYSADSRRWEIVFEGEQEFRFVVRGGLLWFQHVLIAAVEVGKVHQIRLYSRESDATEGRVLHSATLRAPVQVMSLLNNSLLVYTTDNTLYHFLIIPSKGNIRLYLCGSISFEGVVQVPSRVKALSWLVPEAQSNLGDPSDDLIVATIIFLVDRKLLLLRPRRAANDEVRYDMQTLADSIECYWTHLSGVGTLENSLWGYDGSSMRVWLDALTIEATRVDIDKDAYESVKESVSLDLDFYPLSILMDKGIIIGVDHETSTRSLPFSLHKLETRSRLFLPPFLQYHLSTPHLPNALAFAANYQSLIYFTHSLEILLHTVLEADLSPQNKSTLLQTTVEFLDHFTESLEVVVACARKTDPRMWEMLFDVVGKPRDLFEKCLKAGKLDVATSYLLVLHNMEMLDDAKDAVRLLRLAMTAKEYKLCKDILRFLHSIDETGHALRKAIGEVQLLELEPATPLNISNPRLVHPPFTPIFSPASDFDDTPGRVTLTPAD